MFAGERLRVLLSSNRRNLVRSRSEIIVFYGSWLVGSFSSVISHLKYQNPEGTGGGFWLGQTVSQLIKQLISHVIAMDYRSP